MKLVLEGYADFHTEDDGSAAVAEVIDEALDDDTPFVRIQEWHDDPSDNAFVPKLAGRRVRVTIEVL